MSCQSHQSRGRFLQINVLALTSVQRYKNKFSPAIADTQLTQAKENKLLYSNRIHLARDGRLTQEKNKDVYQLKKIIGLKRKKLKSQNSNLKSFSYLCPRYEKTAYTTYRNDAGIICLHA